MGEHAERRERRLEAPMLIAPALVIPALLQGFRVSAVAARQACCGSRRCFGRP
jgi:hypothetical protein